MGMKKVEFEFPDDIEDGDNFEVEGSNMETLDLDPPPKKQPKAKVEVEEDEDEDDDEPVAKKKKGDGDVELEVFDDTPEEDRNRKKAEPPEDPTDEELAHYSEKVQKRIKHFARGYHDERREKERAIRERDELERVARKIMQENEQLRGNFGRSQQVMIEQAKQALTTRMESAKARLRDAYETGNTDEIISAQEDLADARMKFDKVANYKLPSTQGRQQPVPEQAEEVRTQREVTPQVDKKAETWVAENPWFGPDDELTGYALSYHRVLINSGVDPKSDEYYEKLDSRMREKFPEKFDDGELEDEVEEKPRKRSSVVAPVTRGTASKKVRLSKTQVRLAEKLGVPLEEYAKHVAIEENRKAKNG